MKKSRVSKKDILARVRYQKAQPMVDEFNKKKAVDFSIQIKARNVLPYVISTGSFNPGGPEIDIVISEKKRSKRCMILAPFPLDIKAVTKRISAELACFMAKL